MAKQTAKTPDEGFQRLKADLKNGEFQNFYIFCGEEAYLREHYLRLLTEDRRARSTSTASAPKR